MRKLLAVFILAALVCPLPALGAGKATIISFGKRGVPGVGSETKSFAAPSGSPQTARAVPGTASNAANSFVQSAPTNRCTATNVGGSFTYTFGSGVECASFAAPSPDAPVAARARRPQPPSPEQVAGALFDRAVALAPDPELDVAPARLGLTGLPSYFWLSDPLEPLTATATAGPFTITAEAHPADYVWDFGDGGLVTTSGSGREWRARQHGSIAHSYETAGRYDLSVEVLWVARWRTGSGPWRPLGTFSTSDTRPYGVRELLTWLVPWR